MMRMLAWVNLLQNDGLVNQALSLGGLFDVHVDWLDGRSIDRDPRAWSTATCPYMILPLFAGLDRMPGQRPRGRARPRRRPVRDLPPGDLAAEPAGGRRQRAADHCLPMLGDYFTNDLLSGSPSTVDGRQPDQQLGAHARARPARPARSCCSSWSSRCVPMLLVRPHHPRPTGTCGS